jgi:TctA family transporter
MFAIFILVFCAILYPELTGYTFWILVAVLVMMFQDTENYLAHLAPAPAQEMLYGSVNFFV